MVLTQMNNHHPMIRGSCFERANQNHQKLETREEWNHQHRQWSRSMHRKSKSKSSETEELWRMKHRHPMIKNRVSEDWQKILKNWKLVKNEIIYHHPMTKIHALEEQIKINQNLETCEEWNQPSLPNDQDSCFGRANQNHRKLETCISWNN